MKTQIRHFIILLCLATTTLAATKEFTILGDQKITAKVKRGMPLPAEKTGIKIEGAGFVIGGGELTWAFDFISKSAPTRVFIEDVSGKAPIVLVDDSSPEFVVDHWKFGSTPIELSKIGTPWIFEPGDTTKIFRFTITVTGKAEPVVIYQPAVYPIRSKKMLQQMAR
jgi:hypothetical protein